MSTIDRMEIQALRSFGPEEADRQVLTFYKPVTLILGSNGTGKTTIIECLKYACTGDMPAGAKNGSFVYDVKLCREREVKAQVKLSLRDVTGSLCLVSRSLSAKLRDGRGGKITTTTLDGTIARQKVGGEKKSLSSRCADLNREMISALGVSKAVLDNVIFCHQEDSNWPLSEGKILKQKFDSIFDATRYTKVLDEIKKIQQNQKLEIKIGKEELKYLKEKKDKSVELHGDIAELETKLESSVANVDSVKQSLKPIKTRLEQIGKHSHEIYKLQNTKQKHETEKELIEIAVKDLKKNIKNPYQGSSNQLKKELEEFISDVQAKQEQIDICEDKRALLVVTLEETKDEKSRLLVEVGKLQQEAETHEKNINKRNERMTDLAEEYGFDGFESHSAINDEECKRFFSLMKEKVNESMQEAKAQKIDFEAEEKKLQARIDSLRETKTKLEQSVKLKSDTMEKNKKESRDIEKKLKHMATSAEKLDKLKTDLKRAENDLNQCEKSTNCNEIKADIEKLERQKRQLDSDISNLNSEMNRLHKQSEAQTQLNMLKEDQESKAATINRLQNIHEDNIVSLLGHMPVDDLRLSIESYKSIQTESVDKCKSDLVTLKVNLSTKETERSQAVNQLKQKERELREKEDKVANVCESGDFEEELGEVQKNLTQAQEEKGSLLGADHMIKKYIRGLEKNNPNCPLCHRGFERAQEVRELILKLEETRRKVPNNMRKAEQEMESHQTKYDQLMQLKPVRENVTVLREQEIPELKNKVKKLEEEIKKLKQSRENKDEDLLAKESDLEIVKGMHADIVEMDRYKGEVRELEKKIAAQSTVLSRNGSDRSLDDVIAEKEQKQMELDNSNRSLDHQRHKINEFQERVQKLRSKANSLTGEKLIIEGELQQKLQLENTKATLISENANCERDIKECQAQIRPLDGQIRKVLEEKDCVTKKKEEKLAKARDWSEGVVRNGNSVSSLDAEIKNYVKSGKPAKLAECEKKQAKLSADQDNLEQDQEKITEELNKLQKDIASEKVRERELKDSLQLMNKEAEIKNVAVKIEDLNEKLEGFDVRNLEQERQTLMEKEEELTLDLHRATGRQQGFKEEIYSKKKELQSDMYKDASDKYRDEVIKNKTMEISNRDLTKYYKAMEQAIMRYHTSKMEEINRIILHLWQRTYQGNDIDTIEIRSEQDDNIDATGIKSRRNYDYRVVMIKDEIAIDMRTRCSAGQKVLASLIIRLALAETFCVNCGILALDEPTTNLDRSNIESLAAALVDLIKDRHTVRHFQLLVITHDVEFIELLGKADFVDRYVEVSKNDRGLSQLTSRRVEELYK